MHKLMLAVLLPFASSCQGGDSQALPDAASMPTDGSQADARPDSPPRGEDGGQQLAPDCEEPRIENSASVEIEVLALGHCSRVSEGRILAIEENVEEDGVSLVLHEGFDKGGTPHCRVTVKNIGTEIAADISWAIDTTYAAAMNAGTPGQLWIGDGENFWVCDGEKQKLVGYPAILWAGGDPELTPPTYVGQDTQPDWSEAGCKRPEGDCTDYERGYETRYLTRECDFESLYAGSGFTKSVGFDGATQQFKVLRAWQSLECPVPDDEVFTVDFPPGSWISWTIKPG